MLELEAHLEHALDFFDGVQRIACTNAAQAQPLAQGAAGRGHVHLVSVVLVQPRTYLSAGDALRKVVL